MRQAKKYIVKIQLFLIENETEDCFTSAQIFEHKRI